MTPNDIEILIHCHVCPAPHPRIAHNGNVITKFIQLGLIEEADKRNCYRTTSRGAAHVEQLCNLALPTQAWIGADGKVIKP